MSRFAFTYEDPSYEPEVWELEVAEYKEDTVAEKQPETVDHFEELLYN